MSQLFDLELRGYDGDFHEGDVPPRFVTRDGHLFEFRFLNPQPHLLRGTETKPNRTFFTAVYAEVVDYRDLGGRGKS